MLASKRQKLNTSAMNTSGTQEGHGLLEKIQISCLWCHGTWRGLLNDAHPWDILFSPGGLQTHKGSRPGGGHEFGFGWTPDLHNMRDAWRSPLPGDCGEQSVVQAVQFCRFLEKMGGARQSPGSKRLHVSSGSGMNGKLVARDSKLWQWNTKSRHQIGTVTIWN